MHGWNDYFFQTHVADVLSAAGFAFYALDLRRYGRSLRLGQLRGFIADLSEYDQELERGRRPDRADHDQLTLMGHSTGGLTATLWAADHPDRVAGVMLNSPWLDLQGSAMVRALGGPGDRRAGRQPVPTAVLPLPDSGFYARTIHAAHGGGVGLRHRAEDQPVPGRSGSAGCGRSCRGTRRSPPGLGLPMPVLVMTSARTDFARKWHDGLHAADTVLDVEQIARRATKLGRHVTIVRFDGGLHDLFLSRPGPSETSVFDELVRWSGAYLTRAGSVLSDAAFDPVKGH